MEVQLPTNYACSVVAAHVDTGCSQCRLRVASLDCMQAGAHKSSVDFSAPFPDQ